MIQHIQELISKSLYESWLVLAALYYEQLPLYVEGNKFPISVQDVTLEHQLNLSKQAYLAVCNIIGTQVAISWGSSYRVSQRCKAL